MRDHFPWHSLTLLPLLRDSLKNFCQDLSPKHAYHPIWPWTTPFDLGPPQANWAFSSCLSCYIISSVWTFSLQSLKYLPSLPLEKKFAKHCSKIKHLLLKLSFKTSFENDPKDLPCFTTLTDATVIKQIQNWFHPGLQVSFSISMCPGRIAPGSGRLCLSFSKYWLRHKTKKKKKRKKCWGNNRGFVCGY